jgi:anti-sigma28 factor (negative regulator of flagellin synthesis)
MKKHASFAPGKVVQMNKIDQPQELPFESGAERAIRIEQLRKKIEAGTYRVPALDLADRMLERLEWL